MNYRRGRVAITLPRVYTSHGIEAHGPVARTLNAHRPPGRIHVGHARTLLLGELICREKGIPYHVRLDGRGDEQQTEVDGLFDVLNCIRVLGIEPDAVYWQPLVLYSPSYYEARLGAQAARALQAAIKTTGRADATIASLLDDVVDHAPSLMIRGAEFVEIARYARSEYDVRGLGLVVACEQALAAAAGQVRHELTVPLILGESRMKLSKSGLSVAWDVLGSVDRETARAFLVATALCPDDPLVARGVPFKIGEMSDVAYTWDWGIWNRWMLEAR